MPFLLCIDNGHFQYNAVSLGFVIIGLTFFLNSSKISELNALSGAFFFMSSILYKQMSLYFSLPIFFFLLAKSHKTFLKDSLVSSFWLLFSLTCGVIISFTITFLPWFLVNDYDSNSDLENQSKHAIILSRLLQIMNRVFPVGRGIFEDKVASFWCTLDKFIKIKQVFSADQLFKLSMSITLGLTMIVCLHLFWKMINSCSEKTERSLLRYALINTSLIWFLFSYHVHEKTILHV